MDCCQGRSHSRWIQSCLLVKPVIWSDGDLKEQNLVGAVWEVNGGALNKVQLRDICTVSTTTFSHRPTAQASLTDAREAIDDTPTSKAGKVTFRDKHTT